MTSTSQRSCRGGRALATYGSRRAASITTSFGRGSAFDHARCRAPDDGDRDRDGVTCHGRRLVNLAREALGKRSFTISSGGGASVIESPFARADQRRRGHRSAEEYDSRIVREVCVRMPFIDAHDEGHARRAQQGRFARHILGGPEARDLHEDPTSWRYEGEVRKEEGPAGADHGRLPLDPPWRRESPEVLLEARLYLAVVSAGKRVGAGER